MQDRIRQDHYTHWAAVILVGLWTASVFQWWIGILVVLAIIFAISLTNTLILTTTGSFKAVRLNRWIWVLGVFLLIIWMSAETSSV